MDFKGSNTKISVLLCLLNMGLCFFCICFGYLTNDKLWTETSHTSAQCPNMEKPRRVLHKHFVMAVS